MQVHIQRVKRATVRVNNQIVGQIGAGMLVLLGISVNDTQADIDYLTQKLSKLRLFSDENGLMNKNIHDAAAQALVVSQFTLYADTKKGNRPSFLEAARPEIAEPMYLTFVDQLYKLLGQNVPTGVFGADMEVELINDGPVTFVIHSR